MSLKMFLYRIHTKSYPCDADELWFKKFREKYTCPGCRNTYPEARKQGIDVWIKKRPNVSAINSINSTGISIARRDFMELFYEEVNKYLKIGKVFTSDGILVNDFITFVGVNQLILRGGEKSYFKNTPCQCCGRYRYWPAYPWYILRDNLFDQPLFVSWGLNGLIITEELKSRIEKGKWKGIYITKLPVLDEPRDGIKNFPKDFDGTDAQLCKVR